MVRKRKFEGWSTWLVRAKIYISRTSQTHDLWILNAPYECCAIAMKHTFKLQKKVEIQWKNYNLKKIGQIAVIRACYPCAFRLRAVRDHHCNSVARLGLAIARISGCRGRPLAGDPGRGSRMELTFRGRAPPAAGRDRGKWITARPRDNHNSHTERYRCCQQWNALRSKGWNFSNSDTFRPSISVRYVGGYLCLGLLQFGNKFARNAQKIVYLLEIYLYHKSVWCGTSLCEHQLGS